MLPQFVFIQSARPPQPPEDLETWTHHALGDVYELDSWGPSLRAWMKVYPAERIRMAVLAALATGRPTAKYALGVLKSPDRPPADPSKPALSKGDARIQEIERMFKRGQGGPTDG